MAFTCGFFNSVAHDRKYDAVQHGMIFDGIITDGIYATYLKAMVVKASENASEVIVQPGRAWFNHTWSYNDSDYPVAAPEPEVVLDRIDTLVLDVNNEDAVRNNQFLWVQGTPTSQTPEPPTLIHTATHNQYPLCDVYRQAGTTMIYAADITNRVGTSDCPFVTGVLESIDIDDLLAQWDDEFHTWENATKASFEGWMLNQQSVYTAWFNALKTQMAGDVADVEAWIQTIKDIIDEETATHLQLEIDEINSMLPSGSHITVTTTDTELYSRAVTITDEDNNTVTSQFDATGVAVFKSVPYVGNLTIEATDGIRTATADVSTPYFARYEFTLAFWSATLSFNLDSAFGGSVVTIEDSLGTTIGMVTLNGSGDGTFDVGSAGTYTCSMVYGGQTMTQSVNVTQETTYSVYFTPTGSTATPVNDIQTWLHCAGIYNKSYTTLNEVLADNTTLLALISDNNAVDYMARSTNWASSVCTNQTAMGYIGNNDYCANKLLSNSTWATAICNSTYFESVLNVKVPTMTSNTNPTGQVGQTLDTSRSSDAYKAFDGSDSTFATMLMDTSANKANDIYYMFTSQVKVCKLRVLFYNLPTLDNNSITLKIQGSSNGTNWTDIHSQSFKPSKGAFDTIVFANNSKYKYIRMWLSGGTLYSSNVYYTYLKTLQFWGR